MSDPKADLLRYLQSARDAVLWKLEGLSPYDARRPLVPTGTNLLGLVKHLAGVEAGYLGVCFDRPFPEPMPWMEEGTDLFATADETQDDIVALYRRVWAHADATVLALPLDAVGRVPWWSGDRAQVTLHQVLVHLVAEAHRHAGHADLVRELVDGAVGLGPRSTNLPDVDAGWWTGYRARLEQVAREA